MIKLIILTWELILDYPGALNPIASVLLRKRQRDFPGGALVKNPPAKAADMGSSLGPGRSHMPRSN